MQENSTEYTSIKEILDKTGKYTGLTMGTSMWPLLHEQKDNIIIVKNKERLKKYDVALYVTDKGKYIMHRVIEVHDDHYIIVGDNLLEREYVTDDMICGRLAGFFKNGKRYIDCDKSRGYMIYSRVWVALRPIRPVIRFFERIYWHFERKVKNNKNGK